MAVVNTKAVGVTNSDASPAVMNDQVLHHGSVRAIKDTLEVAAADDDNSTYRIARVHSSWSLDEIRLLNDAITAGADFDLGLYDTLANGGAVVDVDAYGSALDLSSAGDNDRAFEARDIANVRKKVWEDAGLSADPQKDFDLVLTANTVGSAAGTISAVIKYTAGD